MKVFLTRVVSAIALLASILAIYSFFNPVQVIEKSIANNTTVTTESPDLYIREAKVDVIVDDVHISMLTIPGSYVEIELLVSNKTESELKNCILDYDYLYVGGGTRYKGYQALHDEVFYTSLAPDLIKWHSIMTDDFHYARLTTDEIYKFKVPESEDSKIKFKSSGLYSAPDKFYIQISCENKISNTIVTQNINFHDRLSFKNWFYVLNSIILTPYLIYKSDN